MDKKDGGTIDLESLLGFTPGPWRWSEVGPFTFELVAGIERVLYRRGDKTGLQHGTINADQVDGPDARLIAAAPDMHAELTARRARDAEVEALVAAAKRTTDAFCALGESTPFTRYADRCLHECEQSMVALDAARTAAHDAPDKCFCDRMYPDSNPNASCGDCPTRDYAPQPPSIPEPSDADVESALREHFIAVCRSNEEGTVGLKNVGMRAALTTDRARLRERGGK